MATFDIQVVCVCGGGMGVCGEGGGGGGGDTTRSTKMCLPRLCYF